VLDNIRRRKDVCCSVHRKSLTAYSIQGRAVFTAGPLKLFSKQHSHCWPVVTTQPFKDQGRFQKAICALRLSILSKFTPIWHHAFAPCAQLFAFSPRFWVRSTLYAHRPTFMNKISKQAEITAHPRFYYGKAF
jgi:hypothetical protein